MEKRTLIICNDEDYERIPALKAKIAGDFDIVRAKDAEPFIKADTTTADLPPILTTMNIFHPPLTRAERRKQARKK